MRCSLLFVKKASIVAMRPPLLVRSLTESEQDELENALRSGEAFTLRRAQIVRLSSRGKRSPEIADDLGCFAQTVRNAIHEFNEGESRAYTARSLVRKI